MLAIIFIGLPAHAKSINILILGDSISAAYGIPKEAGWVSLVEQTLKQRHDVHITNASISGDTTGNGLDRLPKALSQAEFDLVVIELGGNDGLRGFPPNLIKNNLIKLINLAKEETDHVLLMEMRIPRNYGAKYEALFQSTFTQASKTTGVPLVPFFMHNVATNPDLMQKDGIHPNAQGQPLMASNMLPWLEKTINGLAKQ